MQDQVPDVLVVGGGVVGLSVAESAARREMSVLLLERERLGARASWAGAGMLNCRPWPKARPKQPGAAPCNAEPDYFDLLIASLKLHEEWAARLRDETEIDVGFSRCGAVEIYTHSAEDAKRLGQLERLIEGCEERGVPCKQLTASEVSALEPELNTRDVATALHLPGDAQVRPPRLVRALALSCRQREAVLKEGVAVSDLCIEDGRVTGVIAADGTRYSAGNVVICMGAWTGEFKALTRLAPRAASIEPVRGQIVCYQTPAPLCSHLVTVGERYLVPRPDGVLLVGSTTERVGFEAVTTPEGQTMLRYFAEKLFPTLLNNAPLQGWADLRPGLKGQHPLMGPVPGVKGLYVAAGHYRNGLCLAPVTGEIIVSLIRNEQPPVPPEPWLPRSH
jgi:glycine oxidase